MPTNTTFESKLICEVSPITFKNRAITKTKKIMLHIENNK